MPTPPSTGLFVALQVLAVACGLAAAGAAAASVILRWAPGGPAPDARQLKWFLVVLPISLVALVAGFFDFRRPGEPWDWGALFGHLDAGGDRRRGVAVPAV